MPSPLNIQPRGLLEFFGIKAGEWGPRELGQSLAPVIELFRHYVASNGIDFDMIALLNGPDSVQFTNLGFTLFQGPLQTPTVPPGEMWYVDNATLKVQLTPGAAQLFQAASVSATPPGITQNHYLPFAPFPTMASDASLGIHAISPLVQPQFLQPGTTLEAAVAVNVAAGESVLVEFSGRLARLRI